MKCVIWLLLVVPGVVYRSDCGESGTGVRSAGLAGVRTVVPGDTWALVHNPAMLTMQREPRISAFVMPALFGFKELRTLAVNGTFSVAGEAVSAGVEHFGFDLYNELGVRVGLGHAIADGLSAGLALELRRTAIKGYGKTHGILVTAGWIVRITEMLHMGFTGDNIFGETIGVMRQRHPQKAAMGISYSPLPYFRVILEGEKEIRYPLTSRFALELLPLESAAIRLGIADNPDVVSAGFSIRHETLDFGYAGLFHGQLGWTHQVEVSIGIAK